MRSYVETHYRVDREPGDPRIIVDTDGTIQLIGCSLRRSRRRTVPGRQHALVILLAHRHTAHDSSDVIAVVTLVGAWLDAHHQRPCGGRRTTVGHSAPWIYNQQHDAWDNDECAAHVEYDETVGAFYWAVLVVEDYISGPYPGTPDWREYELGEGHELELVEAKWKAMRCYSRAMVDQETQAWDEAQLWSGDPECPDTDWWKVAS